MLDLNNKKCKENQQQQEQPMSEKAASHAFLRKFVFKSPAMATMTSRKMFQRRSNEQEVTRVAAPVEQQKSKAKRATATVLVQQQEEDQPTNETPLQSPQEFLDTLLLSRGYSTQKYKARETAYYSKPTPLQAASFDPYLVSLFDQQGTEAFISVMKSGLSPNARHGETGESLVHCACQAGNDSLLRTLLLTLGSSVQVCDESGRTPLHAACMAAEPSVEVVDLLLSADSDLLCLKDVHDALPLSYVPQQHWAAWIEFLKSKQDTLWPPLSQAQTHKAPALAALPPNSHAFVEDPVTATLPPELATMVAQGRINTFEAQYLLYDGENEFDTSHNDDDDFLDEDSNDDDDASESSAMTFSDLLEGLSIPKPAYPKKKTMTTTTTTTSTTILSSVSRTVQKDSALSKQRLTRA